MWENKIISRYECGRKERLCKYTQKVSNQARKKIIEALNTLELLAEYAMPEK